MAGGGADDDFVRHYDASERKIAVEFLTTWLPFLTRDLCGRCSEALAHRIRSLDPDVGADMEEEIEEASVIPAVVERKEKVSWADMAQEDGELETEAGEAEGRGDEVSEVSEVEAKVGAKAKRVELSREQRERLRFMSVVRKKDFVCFEKIKGKRHNILEGLELHSGVFSSPEQNRIVNFVFELQRRGRNGELGEHTYSEPDKWMRGKGRVTIQFGCCYNYAQDKAGNPPGILRNVMADPLPPLFKTIIKRLVQWHILPPTCIPDSCIVNIYETGDCIPPHIDSHDFVRPFCTISFLSECNIVLGTRLVSTAPGEFAGSASIPLPLGSVLVINGNGADMAKHCIPAVPTKRISITFRKMDDKKIPFTFKQEPDLLCLQPLPYNSDEVVKGTPVSDLSRKHLLQSKMLGRVQKKYVGSPQALQPVTDSQDTSRHGQDAGKSANKAREHVGRPLGSQPDLQDSLVHEREPGNSNNRSSRRRYPVKDSSESGKGDGILRKFAGGQNINPTGICSNQDDSKRPTFKADGAMGRFAGRLNFNSPGAEPHQDDSFTGQTDGGAARLIGMLNLSSPGTEHHQDDSGHSTPETLRVQREPPMKIVHMDEKRIVVKSCPEDADGFSQSRGRLDPNHSDPYRAPTQTQSRFGTSRPRS